MLARGGDAADRIAAEVLANVAAMEAAVELGSTNDAITLDDLLAIHRILMDRSSMPHIGGVVRTEQNWIGGSSYNPCSAAFVPPPPQSLDDLLGDLLDYVNGDDHPPLVQAAIAHAQFETIHPFADGNGRTGRALIHVILRRRGLAPRFVPPISLVLATWASDYIAGLTAFRHLGAPSSPERSTGASTWLRTFATAAHRSCNDAEAYAEQVETLDARWREQLGRVRSNSAVELLIDLLPGVPVVTVESAARLIGRSEMRTGEAVNRLEAARHLAPAQRGTPALSSLRSGRRHRALHRPRTSLGKPHRRHSDNTAEPSGAASAADHRRTVLSTHGLVRSSISRAWSLASMTRMPMAPRPSYGTTTMSVIDSVRVTWIWRWAQETRDVNDETELAIAHVDR